MRYIVSLLMPFAVLSGFLAHAETLNDFVGHYQLSFEDKYRIGNPAEAIPCKQFLTIREDGGAGLWVDQFNDHKVIHQLYFGLGVEELDAKHFAITSQDNNTVTRHLYKKTVFAPKGKQISGHYMALLPDGYTVGYGANLYFEQSGRGYITSACYYVKDDQ